MVNLNKQQRQSFKETHWIINKKEEKKETEKENI